MHLLHNLVARPVGFDRDPVHLAQHVVFRPPATCANVERAIDRRVGVRTARVQLVPVLADLPSCAESVGHARRIKRRAERAEETAFAFEDARRPGESGTRQVGGENPVHRGLAWMQMLAHRAIRVELPERRRLRAGAPERVHHIVHAQVQQRSCRGGRAKRRDRAGRVKEIVVARIHRFPDAERGLVPDRHGGKERTAIRVLPFRDRKRRRDNRRRRMDGRSPVDVVELEDV